MGTTVGSCRKCDECNAGLENYCEGRMKTYNYKLSTPEQRELINTGWGRTIGGYSERITVNRRYGSL